MVSKARFRSSILVGWVLAAYLLAVIPEGLANNRIVYRYITPDSCSIVENCVSGSG